MLDRGAVAGPGPFAAETPDWPHLLAVTLDATQRITLLTDADCDGVIDPGDTVGFTIEITNSRDMDATTVAYAATLGRMSLVANSINVAPLAVDDADDAIGNLSLWVPAGMGLFGNDVEFFSDRVALGSFDAASAHDGALTVNATGSSTDDARPASRATTASPPRSPTGPRPTARPTP